MPRNDWLVCIFLASLVGVLGAQETRPGYLDPEPILRAAETAIGMWETAFFCRRLLLRHTFFD